MTRGAEPAASFVASARQPRLLWVAAIVSLLLHAAIPAAFHLDLFALLERGQPPAEMVVDIVALPPPADAEPEPEPMPEPEPEPPPAVNVPIPPPLPLPLVLSPPPPQLEEAPIAEKSRHADDQPRATEDPPPPPPPPPGAPAERPRQRQPRGEARGNATPPPPETTRRAEVPDLIDRSQPTIGRGVRGGGSAAERRQQSEGDFVLAQIMPHWLIDVRSPRFRGVVLGGTFLLRADGTLAPPYGKSDPWAPEVMIQNYRQLNTPQGEPVRIALESFLRAARSAQPFRLPPGATGGYPRPIRIVFDMGDL